MRKIYKIGICDDDFTMSNRIKHVVENYFHKSSCGVYISMFSNAEEFLKSEFDVDYLFLDIEMPGMSGIDLKELLQLENFKFGIIFVTSYKQYRDEAFGKNVVAFINKNKLEKITEVLSKIEKNDRDFNVIKISGVLIDTRTIFYLKADRGYVNIVTSTKEYLFCGTLSEIVTRINNEQFIQIHRSYIVNMRYVENKSYNYIVLSRDYKLPLSRKYKENFEQKYFKYLRDG